METATPKKRGLGKFIKFVILGTLGVFVLIAIIGVIFGPSKEELEAKEKAEQTRRDSIAAAQHAADSLAAVRKQQEWEAMPKEERDAILAQRREDSLGQIAKAKEMERQAEEADKRDNPMNYLKVKKSSWQKGGFGTVGEMSITFENGSLKTARDIVVTATFYGESGTALTTSTQTITTVVPPGKTKSVKDINFGFIDQQSERAGVEIVTASFD